MRLIVRLIAADEEPHRNLFAISLQLSARAQEMIQQILLSTEARISALLGEIRSSLHIVFRLGTCLHAQL